MKCKTERRASVQYHVHLPDHFFFRWLWRSSWHRRSQARMVTIFIFLFWHNRKNPLQRERYKRMVTTIILDSFRIHENLLNFVSVITKFLFIQSTRSSSFGVPRDAATLVVVVLSFFFRLSRERGLEREWRRLGLM